MSQPRNWWMGLLPLALLWAWVVWSQTGKYEQDLASRSGVAVLQTGADLDSAKVVAKGRDVTIQGVSLKAGADKAAVAAAKATVGVRQASAALKPLPVIKPYTFSAERAGEKVTLAGHVPSRALRDQLVDAAKASAGKDGLVVDELKYGAGAAPSFAAAAAHGVKQLGHLPNGKYSLSDSVF